MKHVKYVDLVLEPYQDMRFTADQLDVFGCDKIQNRIARIAGNSIANMLICKRMYMELSPDANEYIPEMEELAFDRLGIPDITAVRVTYEDESMDYIFVPWGGGQDYQNGYQTSYITPRGSLRLLIDKKRQVKDFFHADQDAACVDKAPDDYEQMGAADWIDDDLEDVADRIDDDLA